MVNGGTIFAPQAASNGRRDCHDWRWFNVVPFFNRGSEFQVHADRPASLRGDDSWEPVLE